MLEDKAYCPQGVPNSRIETALDISLGFASLRL